MERTEASQARAGANASSTGSQYSSDITRAADASAYRQDDAASRDLPRTRGAVKKTIPDRSSSELPVPTVGRGLPQLRAVVPGDSFPGLSWVTIFGQTFRRTVEGIFT